MYLHTLCVSSCARILTRPFDACTHAQGQRVRRAFRVARDVVCENASAAPASQLHSSEPPNHALHTQVARVPDRSHRPLSLPPHSGSPGHSGTSQATPPRLGVHVQVAVRDVVAGGNPGVELSELLGLVNGVVPGAAGSSGGGSVAGGDSDTDALPQLHTPLPEQTAPPASGHGSWHASPVWVAAHAQTAAAPSGPQVRPILTPSALAHEHAPFPLQLFKTPSHFGVSHISPDHVALQMHAGTSSVSSHAPRPEHCTPSRSGQIGTLHASPSHSASHSHRCCTL
eukprot:6209928-Pleurochrysis_carterae.AAC.2